MTTSEARAYYNEHDPYAAAWLRNLIAAGHIAPGDVDERSIEDVRPADLRSYRQCHFFAGVGVWSYALRRAGVPDDVRLWTGSCPCQPFSSAGAGAGFADQRHLWPAFFHLIEQCRPPVVLGEQVASKAVGPWIDLVHADLEAVGYAFGSVAFPSAGVGAPHIRDRAYWAAHANGSTSREGRAHVRGWLAGGDAQPRTGLGGGGVPDGLADTASAGSQGLQPSGQRVDPQRPPTERGSEAGGLDNPERQRFDQVRHGHNSRYDRQLVGAAVQGSAGPGPVNGFWRAADWLYCRDERWRPVEPGSFPLVDGAAARVGRLRAYGNAINAEAAWVFIEALSLA